jgi:hypothetical protein
MQSVPASSRVCPDRAGIVPVFCAGLIRGAGGEIAGGTYIGFNDRHAATKLPGSSGVILRYLKNPVFLWISTCSYKSDKSSLMANFILTFPCNNALKEKAGFILMSTMSSARMTNVFGIIQHRSSIRSGKTR